MLVLAVDTPPLDLQPRRLARVEPLAVASAQEPVEALHCAACPVRVVVGVGRPQLVGAQHEPGSPQRGGPRQTEGVTGERDGGTQEGDPFAAVVRHPRIALETPHPPWVEGAMRRDAARALVPVRPAGWAPKRPGGHRQRPAVWARLSPRLAMKPLASSRSVLFAGARKPLSVWGAYTPSCSHPVYWRVSSPISFAS